MKRITIILWAACMSIYSSGISQATVFGILRDPLKLADESFLVENYPEAIGLYQTSLNHNPDNVQTQIKLAQSLYLSKQYQKSISVYNSCLHNSANALSWKDLYYYAEAQAVLKNYNTALDFYNRCLKLEPSNDIVSKKIWRLNNLQYLYEDSSHFAIRPVSLNTTSGELCAVPYQNGIVFTSNQRGPEWIEKINGKLNAPFYQLYSSSWKRDSVNQSHSYLNEPAVFARSLKSKYNIGPVAFYNHGQKMVLVSSSSELDNEGNRNLGLYFAELEHKKWKIVSSFQYNSAGYSINDVTISEDGMTMYFSSNMNGGIGGKDIYLTQRVDGRWSKPANIGEPVNTTQNEVFPYLHGNGILYFSSDGHPGMGGLDLFKTQIKFNTYDEPQNLGYPMNSSFDDFGLSFDSLTTQHGYLTSNRKNGGYDDDIYEFDLDLQTYPFTITGVIKFKEHTWSDQSENKIWPHVKITLFDSWQGTSVFENTTDENGNFSISIPYFSKYYIRIVDEDGSEHKAILEIQKQRSETHVHEIVIVKDVFGKNGEQK